MYPSLANFIFIRSYLGGCLFVLSMAWISVFEPAPKSLDDFGLGSFFCSKAFSACKDKPWAKASPLARILAYTLSFSHHISLGEWLFCCLASFTKRMHLHPFSIFLFSVFSLIKQSSDYHYYSKNN